MANEQLNPTPEEEREPLAAEEAAVQQPVVERRSGPAVFTVNEDEDDDAGEEVGDDADDDADDEEEEESVERSVEGPAQYAPREKGGRMQRVGRDVRADDVNYKNIGLLSRFLDGRGRILSRRKTRVSAKIQRKVVKAIKHARHLALLPYTGDHSRIVRKRR